VRKAGQDHLFQRARLPGDRRGDARFRMAEQVGPPTRYGVEVAASVVAYQPGAFAARDRHQRQYVGVLAHLRARVPQHREVAGSPAIGVRYHRAIVNPVLHPRIIHRPRPAAACPRMPHPCREHSLGEATR